jgi:pSer/pThr/pTyr-binding forkhead associated (FHA) protein
MDIKKLFNRNKAPKNIGNNSHDERVPDSYVDKIYLSFPDIEGEPTFELVDVLTIGSEVGDAIVVDDNVSPRHCTFTLNQDVISLMDHNSLDGTFINKKQIDPGKILILQDKDKIRIGNLEIFIDKVEEAVYDEELEEESNESNFDSDSTSEIEVSALDEEEIIDDIEDDIEDEIPDIPMPETSDLTVSDLQHNEEEVQESEEEIEEEIEEEVLPKRTLQASGQKELREKSGKSLVFKGFVPGSTNALIRVIAILIEALIIILTFSFIGGNDAFFNLLKVYPAKVVQLLKPHYEKHLDIYINKLISLVPALPKIWEEILSFFDKYPDIYYGLILFLCIRIITPLVFGVSIGQALVGVKGRGNIIGKRILGVIRECIGLLTLPFIIFDLPCLVSKRTFKEILTFTHLETASKVKSLFLSILLFLVLGTSYFVSPMLIDFKIKSSIPVSNESIKFKKVELADIQSEYSKSLNLAFVEDEQNIVLPVFKIIQSNNKRKLIPSFNMINLNTKKKINITKSKSFSLEKLLHLGVKSNYMASMKFPKVVGIVNSVANTNKNFKQSSYKDELLFSEIENLIKASFSLSFMNLHEHVIKYGPFVKGFVDLRFNIESIIKEPVVMVTSAQLGDSPFALLQTSEGLSYFEINNKEVSLYKSDTKRVKDLITFYKSIRLITPEDIDSNDSKISLISFVDEFLSEKEKGIKFYQASYELLFSKSKEFIITDDNLLTKELESSVASILQVIDYVPGNDKDKFVQNITDLLKAIKDNDKQFFGVSEVKSASTSKRVGR